MGLFIICFDERKTIWNQGFGPYVHPLFVFLKTLQNQTEYKTNNNATKTSNTEDIEEYQEKKVMSINKHKLSKNIAKHCKKGAHSVTLSLPWFPPTRLPQPTPGPCNAALARLKPLDFCGSALGEKPRWRCLCA